MLQQITFDCLIVTLAASTLCADEGDALSAFRFKRLSVAARREVDESARHVRPESTLQLTRRATGGIAGGIVSKAPLREPDEVRFAVSELERLVEKYGTVRTPRPARDVFDRLVKNLPGNPPARFDFELTVLDEKSLAALTVGGGRVCIGRRYLKRLLADKDHAESRLAFVLAHELGHVVRGHTARAARLDGLEKRLTEKEFNTLKKKYIALAAARAAKNIGPFLYTRVEDREADLFALHLCRNAGFDLEDALDPLRAEAILETDKSNAANHKPGPALRRLARLRRELDGRLPEGYGLRKLDRESGEFEPIQDQALSQVPRALLFIHGMDSSPKTFVPLIGRLDASEDAEKYPVLVFHYPGDDSIALSALGLERELDRVGAGNSKLLCVCHSAGGLVFRWYAERRGGTFERAVFVATPHGGSDMAPLRFWLEYSQFFSNLSFGYPAALRKVIQDGTGQIQYDLRPNSLFLKHLNAANAEDLRKRYTIIRGRALSRTASLGLRAAVKAGQIAARQALYRAEKNRLWRDMAESALEQATVPREISKGDLAVTLESAGLEGVEGVHTVRGNHGSMLKSGDVAELVAEALFPDQEP